ncbi:hypothetical protein HF995_13430 [Sanguibacter hominis ATCC BAA-789]|uniref:Uncharacterized protein n=1 Tax=Sanguibacter hominis ATCC BAA-789 TaxID=1312740 RepID=A0A9X5FDR1_9MICO|nr:hypothetical protein [Sanguibacter hominis]NKX94258.1 hypothetical protein [Sanguibacter hominis ATCC BAA-789]
MLATLEANLTSTALAVLPAKIDPGVKVNWSFFPFMKTLKDAAGGLIAVGLVIGVIGIVIGAIMLMMAKSTKSTRMSDASATVLLWVIGTSAVIASASGLIMWGASQSLGV